MRLFILREGKLGYMLLFWYTYHCTLLSKEKSGGFWIIVHSVPSTATCRSGCSQLTMYCTELRGSLRLLDTSPQPPFGTSCSELRVLSEACFYFIFEIQLLLLSHSVASNSLRPYGLQDARPNTALLRCNSHAIQFTLLEYTIQWVLVYSQVWATITTI